MRCYFNRMSLDLIIYQEAFTLIPVLRVFKAVVVVHLEHQVASLNLCAFQSGTTKGNSLTNQPLTGTFLLVKGAFRWSACTFPLHPSFTTLFTQSAIFYDDLLLTMRYGREICRGSLNWAELCWRRVSLDLIQRLTDSRRREEVIQFWIPQLHMLGSCLYQLI